MCRIEVGRTDEGTPLYRYFYGTTKSGVEAKANTVQKQTPDGVVGLPPKFATWALQWYDGYRDEVSKTTYDGYRYTLNILLDYFGNQRVDEIKPIHIEVFLKAMVSSGRSSSYTTKLKSMLQQIMRKAEANDLISKNPVGLADKVRNKNITKEREAFTSDEVSLLMKHLPIDKMGVTIRVMLGTGLRTQEVLALAPQHIEESGKMIYVRQAVKVVKGIPEIGCTKSENGVRDIPIPKDIQKYAAKLRGWGSDEFIWANTNTGRVITPGYFRKQFAKTISTVPGVRLLTPYSCRHTYITMLVESGVGIKTVQKLAGHGSTKMSLHYTHVQDDTKEKAVDQVNEIFKCS